MAKNEVARKAYERQLALWKAAKEIERAQQAAAAKKKNFEYELRTRKKMEKGDKGGERMQDLHARLAERLHKLSEAPKLSKTDREQLESLSKACAKRAEDKKQGFDQTTEDAVKLVQSTMPPPADSKPDGIVGDATWSNLLSNGDKHSQQKSGLKLVGTRERDKGDSFLRHPSTKRDPKTGKAVDPATGKEADPKTGKVTDTQTQPATDPKAAKPDGLDPKKPDSKALTGEETEKVQKAATDIVNKAKEEPMTLDGGRSVSKAIADGVKAFKDNPEAQRKFIEAIAPAMEKLGTVVGGIYDTPLDKQDKQFRKDVLTNLSRAADSISSDPDDPKSGAELVKTFAKPFAKSVPNSWIYQSHAHESRLGNSLHAAITDPSKPGETRPGITFAVGLAAALRQQDNVALAAGGIGRLRKDSAAWDVEKLVREVLQETEAQFNGQRMNVEPLKTTLDKKVGQWKLLVAEGLMTQEAMDGEVAAYKKENALKYARFQDKAAAYVSILKGAGLAIELGVESETAKKLLTDERLDQLSHSEAGRTFILSELKELDLNGSSPVTGYLDRKYLKNPEVGTIAKAEEALKAGSQDFDVLPEVKAEGEKRLRDEFLRAHSRLRGQV